MSRILNYDQPSLFHAPVLGPFLHLVSPGFWSLVLESLVLVLVAPPPWLSSVLNFRLLPRSLRSFHGTAGCWVLGAAVDAGAGVT